MSDVLGIEEASRLLSDSRAESRQRAAATIAQRAAALFRDQPVEEACHVLLAERDRVQHLYLDAISATRRRAGLIALRATLSGLPHRAFPESVVRAYAVPITDSFTDADPVVRLAAVEAAYELVRRLREQVVQLCFGVLFRALACAVSDADHRVAFLGREVSLVVKEVVVGSPLPCLEAALLAVFVRDTLEPFAAEPGGLGATLPVTVAWVLDWVRFAFDTPGIALAACLPVFLPMLLSVAAHVAPSGGGSGEALVTLHTCQYELKKALALQAADDTDVAEVVRALLFAVVADSGAADAVIDVRRLCLSWLRELCLLAMAGCSGPAGPGTVAAAVHGLADDILRAVLPQLSATETGVRSVAQRLNDDLLRLVAGDASQKATDTALASRILAIVCGYFAVTATYNEATSLAALRWLAALPPNVEEDSAQAYTVRDCVVAILCDSTSVTGTRAAAEVLLALVGCNARCYDSAVTAVLRRVRSHPDALLARLPAVLKALQTSTEADGQCGDGPASVTRLMTAVAKALAAMAPCEEAALSLPQTADMRCVCKCVVAANAVLFTAEEFSGLRAVLRGGDAAAMPESIAAFEGLLVGWKYSAVALLGLSLLAEQHAMALRVCHHLGEVEASAATLVQVDRLVQSLEGPVFAHLRLRLLRPSENAALVEALYALLMVLPQWSPQFPALHTRLSLVNGLAQLQFHRVPAGGGAADSRSVAAYIDSFLECQRCLRRAETESAGRND